MKMEERDEMIREHMEIRQARKSAEKQIDKKDENRKSDIEIGLEILWHFLEIFTARIKPLTVASYFLWFCLLGGIFDFCNLESQRSSITVAPSSYYFCQQERFSRFLNVLARNMQFHGALFSWNFLPKIGSKFENLYDRITFAK